MGVRAEEGAEEGAAAVRRMVYGRDEGLEFVEGGERTVYKEDLNKEMLVVGQTPNIMCLIKSTLIR